jgi:hypothetical protein
MDRHDTTAPAPEPLPLERPDWYDSELPSLEQLMREQGIAGPQGPALWQSYPRGTREEEDAFYRAIVEECW